MNSKEYFEKVADQWDEMRSSFFSEKVREKAYRVADIKKGKQAADIGAGTGFVTEGLVREGLDVVAVDQSQTMIEELKRKFPDIDCRYGEAENLPIASETMDYVFANMYLHHVERPASAIKEMTRILTKGGQLVITDLDEHNFEFLKREHHDRWMGFKREAILKWFTDAGLTDVKVECVGQNCCANSCDGTNSAEVSIFIARGIKR
jgi:ubiquinone/menaquinone biosynthesis C-methylase UbiE